MNLPLKLFVNFCQGVGVDLKALVQPEQLEVVEGLRRFTYGATGAAEYVAAGGRGKRRGASPANSAFSRKIGSAIGRKIKQVLLIFWLEFWSWNLADCCEGGRKFDFG